jgi:ethanolamine utilization protein EutN
MRIARIKGHVTSTVKHRSLDGWRLLIAQPVNTDETSDGPAQIVIDCLGAGIGQKVLINSDGSEARKMVEDETSPARWFVCGVIDPEGSLAL